jgi:hypothetical protein
MAELTDGSSVEVAAGAVDERSCPIASQFGLGPGIDHQP